MDLQLESGEYFLKPHERAARETERRKQKVRKERLASLPNVMSLLSSMKKQLTVDGQSGQQRSSHRLKRLRFLSKKNERGSDSRIPLSRERRWTREGRKGRTWGNVLQMASSSGFTIIKYFHEPLLLVGSKCLKSLVTHQGSFILSWGKLDMH